MTSRLLEEAAEMEKDLLSVGIKMKTSSNKAKGRTGQQAIRDLILSVFPELEADDVRSTSMGSSGEDLLLSPAARKLLPWNIEVKRKKKIAACRFMDQAKSHGNYKPVAFFREDHGPWYACVDARYLLELKRIIQILEATS